MALVPRLALKTRFSEMGWGSTPPSSAKTCILNSVGRVPRLHRGCRRFESVRMYHKRSIKRELFPWIDQHVIKSKPTCGSRIKSLLIFALCLLVQRYHGFVSGNHTHIYSRIVKWYNGRLISDYYKFNSCSGYQFLKGDLS